MNPYLVVRDFEDALCEYTGSHYAVAVSSCTMAIQLAVAWCLSNEAIPPEMHPVNVEIPKRTYVSVPMSIIHAGGKPVFRDENWLGRYRLDPLPVFDSARWFYSGMFNDVKIEDTRFRATGTQPMIAQERNIMLCASFHASKTLGDTQGGAILHDSPEADVWLRKARFDGRTEGVAPKDDTFTQIGYHCYMSPDVAARLLLKMYSLPKHNDPLPNDDYPDLSLMEIFK